MKIKTTHLVIFLPLTVIFLSQGDKMKATLDRGAVITQQNSDASSETRMIREKSKAESKVALERVKSNCITTVNTKTKRPGRYIPGALVFDDKIQLPVRSGAFVCNHFGETAKVDENGAITGLATVSLNDKAKYDDLFKKLRGERNGSTRKTSTRK